MSKPHDPAKRAAVLMALAQKQPVTHISTSLSVPVRTIYYWRDEARAAEAANGAPGASEATSATSAASVASVASAKPARAARSRALPTSESERALRAELASAHSKLSILRQALLIVAGG